MFKTLILILPIMIIAGCSSCRCTPEIEENEKLIIPPDLKTLPPVEVTSTKSD